MKRLSFSVFSNVFPSNDTDPKNPVLLTGIWKASLPLLGVEETVHIRTNNIIHFDNPVDGLKIFSYALAKNKINLVNLETGERIIWDFKVLDDCKVLEINNISYRLQ
jgi:hypothetical protein